MAVALISLIGFALVALALREYAGVRVCPVCAGVAITWGWMLLALVLWPELSETYRLPIAILMGASVSGGMYALSERITFSPPLAALWKIGFVVSGVGAAYAVVARSPLAELALYLGALALAATVALVMGRAGGVGGRGEKTGGEEREVERIKNAMEECC